MGLQRWLNGEIYAPLGLDEVLNKQIHLFRKQVRKVGLRHCVEPHTQSSPGEGDVLFGLLADSLDLVVVLAPVPERFGAYREQYALANPRDVMIEPEELHCGRTADTATRCCGMILGQPPLPFRPVDAVEPAGA